MHADIADCSVKFNRSMRLLARHLGYSLNQRGLYTGVVRDPKNQQKITEGLCAIFRCVFGSASSHARPFSGTLIASRTEREIFDILKVPWQEPHERVRSF